MNEEQNKIVVKRLIDEMWNQRKLQLADELFATDCVTHQLRTGKSAAGTPRTAESVKREATAWLTGFPDLEFVLEQIIAAGDRVVSQRIMRGTHTGVWMGGGTYRNQGEHPDDYDSSYCGRKDCGRLGIGRIIDIIPATRSHS